MTMSSALLQATSLPVLTLAAAAQALLAIKLLPNYYEGQSHLSAVAGMLLVNYTFGLVFRLLVWPRLFNPLRHIPGPKKWISVSRRAMTAKDRAGGDLFMDLAAEYPGQPLIMTNALRDQIMVADPSVLPEILVHRCYDFTKPTKSAAFLRRILGEGLVVAEGDHHRVLRKHSMPAFNFRHIKDLYPMMWDKAELLTRILGGEVAAGAAIELGTWANKITLDIIGVAGMGRDINAAQKASDPIQSAYEKLLEPSREAMLYGMAYFLLGPRVVRWLPWRMNRVFDETGDRLDAICQQLIRDKRSAIVDKEDSHFDVLSLLIKTNKFSDPVLKDQLLTFLAAGHETTASSLTWAAYMLAKHPHIQDKLRAEVSAASLPTDPSTAADPETDLAATLEQMPWLNGVINETLRLYPTVPATARQAIRDTRVGDQVIPRGTMLLICIWQINRSPDLWGPTSLEWHPERWIEPDGRPNQTGGMSSNYNFMTFLHGPRSCIGQGFARAEMRCLLATLVRSFRWELAMDEAKIIPRGVITIKPESGLYLKLTPIEEKA